MAPGEIKEKGESEEAQLSEVDDSGNQGSTEKKYPNLSTMTENGAVVTRVRPLSSERAVPVPCKINDVKTDTDRN